MQKRKSVPGQMEIGVNGTDAVNREPENARNGLQQICIQSKSHPREINTGKKEPLSKESFWKEALKSDSLLWWITRNIGHFREERT